MTHPWIEASLKYRKAQAIVLREAESFVASANANALVDAVKEMQKLRAEYQEQKSKVAMDTGGHESTKR